MTICAKVAELVDAQDSGSCGVTPVGVRFPPFAPSRTLHTYHTNPSFSNIFSLSRVIVGNNKVRRAGAGRRFGWTPSKSPSMRPGSEILLEKASDGDRFIAKLREIMALP